MNAIIDKKTFLKFCLRLISAAMEQRIAVVSERAKDIWFSGPGEGNYFTPASGVFLDFKGVLAELICQIVRFGEPYSVFTSRHQTGEGWKGRTPLSETDVFCDLRRSYQKKSDFRHISVEETLHRIVGFTEEEVSFLLKRPNLRYLTISVAKERLKKLLLNL